MPRLERGSEMRVRDDHTARRHRTVRVEPVEDDHWQWLLSGMLRRSHKRVVVEFTRQPHRLGAKIMQHRPDDGALARAREPVYYHLLMTREVSRERDSFVASTDKRFIACPSGP